MGVLDGTDTMALTSSPKQEIALDTPGALAHPERAASDYLIITSPRGNLA